jgi:hypothetical protein
MKPEDVDAWLVEKAYQAYLDDYAEGVEDSMPAILAAVLPLYGAQVLEEAHDALVDKPADLDEAPGLTTAQDLLFERAACLREGSTS